jgi:hypothetical protein
VYKIREEMTGQKTKTHRTKRCPVVGGGRHKEGREREREREREEEEEEEEEEEKEKKR